MGKPRTGQDNSPVTAAFNGQFYITFMTIVIQPVFFVFSRQLTNLTSRVYSGQNDFELQVNIDKK